MATCLFAQQPTVYLSETSPVTTPSNYPVMTRPMDGASDESDKCSGPYAWRCTATSAWRKRFSSPAATDGGVVSSMSSNSSNADVVDGVTAPAVSSSRYASGLSLAEMFVAKMPRVTGRDMNVSAPISF